MMNVLTSLKRLQAIKHDSEENPYLADLINNLEAFVTRCLISCLPHTNPISLNAGYPDGKALKHAGSPNLA